MGNLQVMENACKRCNLAISMPDAALVLAVGGGIRYSQLELRFR